MKSQAEGLAAAIGIPFVAKVVKLRAPWRWLPGHWCPDALRFMAPEGDALAPPWPCLLISCGRRSVAPSIAVRRASRGRTFTVHIQNPHVPVGQFDLVVVPAHDNVDIKGPNVVVTQAALHGVTPAVLAAARDRWSAQFARLPEPRIAVMIGGTNRYYRLTAAVAAALGDQLARLAKEIGAGLMVSTSRRTGESNVDILRRRLLGTKCVFWSGEGENPYFGMLALAQHVLVTADSVSMVSEACATGKPVQIIPLPGGGRRFARFHEIMRNAGLTRPFAGRLETWSYQPPDDTARAAALIRARLGERPTA